MHYPRFTHALYIAAAPKLQSHPCPWVLLVCVCVCACISMCVWESLYLYPPAVFIFLSAAGHSATPNTHTHIHTHTFPFFPQASFSLMCSHCLINQWSLSHVLLLYRLCSLFFSTSSQLSSPLYCMQTHTCIHFQSILSLISLDCL